MMLRTKKADAGISTLILFIAMIIVAGITANVLVQSAQSMQNRALHTGDQARRAISTFVETNRITGINVTNRSINDIRLDVKLTPGSDPVDLRYAMISAETSSYGATYTFDDGDCVRGENGYQIDSENYNGTFTVRYLLESSSATDGYITSGDRVELCFALPSPLVEDRHMSIRFNPQIGLSTYASFVSSRIISSERVRLYP